MQSLNHKNFVVRVNGFVVTPYTQEVALYKSYVHPNFDDGRSTCFSVPRKVFNQVKYFTRNTGEKNIKYLVANDKEINHLQSLNINAQKNCDRFVICSLT